MVESSHVQAKSILTEHQGALEKLAEVLIKRETIEREQFEALLQGQSEAEVFGSEAPPPPQVPIPTEPQSERGRTEGPRPLPRPGFAAD